MNTLQKFVNWYVPNNCHQYASKRFKCIFPQFSPRWVCDKLQFHFVLSNHPRMSWHRHTNTLTFVATICHYIFNTQPTRNLKSRAVAFSRLNKKHNIYTNIYTQRVEIEFRNQWMPKTHLYYKTRFYKRLSQYVYIVFW